MTDERVLEILSCLDDVWQAYYEIVPPQGSSFRRPTVHELQALRRRGLVTHRPKGATVGPGVWATTHHGDALLHGGDPEDYITVPTAERRR